MKWRAEHFNGTDWDNRERKNAIYKLIDDPATLPEPFVQPRRRRPSASASVPAMGPLTALRRRFSGGGSGGSGQQETASKTDTPPPQRPGKGWAEDVDKEHGNNDFLMFSNIDYTHPEVRADTENWGGWMINSVGVDAFRLDAVQHFSFHFTRDWIRHVNDASRKQYGKDTFVVGEVWTADVRRILKWLDAVQLPLSQGGPQVYAYDSPLLYNFSRISEDIRRRSRNTDLRTILRSSLLELRPEAAVTLVTNHDTQPGQTCYTPMLRQIKVLFYAFILLRKESSP